MAGTVGDGLVANAPKLIGFCEWEGCEGVPVWGSSETHHVHRDGIFLVTRSEEISRVRAGRLVGQAEAVKADAGKPRTDLLPADALLSVSHVLAYGVEKYEARNWEKGMGWGRLVAASTRHLFAWMTGEEKDPESGLPHLAHFACDALMLHALVLRKVGTDDRGVKP